MANREITVTNSSQAAPRLNIVLLHGYAMTPAGLSPFAHSLGVPALFHFPEGSGLCPEGGRCWWPRQARNGRPDLAEAHPPQREAARAELHDVLCRITSRWPNLPLVLGGFSQGAMLSCDYLLLHEAVPAAALALMSGSRLAFDEWRPRLQRLKGLPVFVAHGTHDDELSFSAGQALEASLREAGARTQWLPFDGGHEIPLVVWRAFKKFLIARYPAP